MIIIDAPTGKIDAKISLQSTNCVWTGEMSGKAGTGPMMDIKVDGTSVSWTTKIERPMPMKLKFRGVRDGDEISGSVKFGVFASGTFTGTRKIEEPAQKITAL